MHMASRKSVGSPTRLASWSGLQEEATMRLDRIKLLKFVSCCGGGGTERQVGNFVRALDPSQLESHLACLNRWGLLDELGSSGAPVTEYKITRLYNHTAFMQQLKFARYIRRHRIQIVHTYGFYPNVFAIPAASLAGGPVIVASIRDTGETWTPIQRRVQKIACRLADRVVVNAEAIKRRLFSEGYRPEQVTVIHNGIDLSQFTRNTRGSSLHEELGLPQSVPIIAVLCRLHRFKGI